MIRIRILSHVCKGNACVNVQRASNCVSRSMLTNALTLSLSLVYPMCSPYLSLMTLGQHGMVYPFIFFSNCSYKFKRVLVFVPMLFFVYLRYPMHTDLAALGFLIGVNMKIQIEIRSQYGNTVAYPICQAAKLFTRISIKTYRGCLDICQVIVISAFDGISQALRRMQSAVENGCLLLAIPF